MAGTSPAMTKSDAFADAAPSPRRHRLLDQPYPVRCAVAEDIVVERVAGMVAFIAVAHAEKDEGAGACFQHECEIFRTHQRHRAVVDAVGADDIACYLCGDAGFARVIYRDRI